MLFKIQSNHRRIARWVATVASIALVLPMAAVEPVIAAKPTKEQRAELKASKPGKFHKDLRQLTGEWSIQIEIDGGQSAPLQTFTGTSRNEWIMGKRFVRMQYKTRSSGRKIQGESVIGYDNVKQQYTGVSISNISSGIASFTGQAKVPAKFYEFELQDTQKINGAEMTASAYLEIHNKQRFEFRITETDKADPAITRSVTIHYTRKKSP